MPLRAVQFSTEPTATPYDYSYLKVDDEGGSQTFNRILGMDDLGAVVGYFSSGSITKGFNSFPPYTKFRVIDYPNSQSTVATSMSNNLYFAGYFHDTGRGGHTWGFIRYKGIWGMYQDSHTPKGPNTVNQILGINDNDIAVGFYVDSNGHDQPFEYSNRHYAGLKPPNAISAQATGINLRGDIVGTELLSNGNTVGWIYRSGAYKQIQYPNSTDTEPTGANLQDQVVGSYVDAYGTHGFVATAPGNPSQANWQTIDEPDAAATTVVTSINNHHAISGWYVDANGNNNGFVATIPH